MPAYYNENDSYVAAWLRELIRNGLIADGEVDERSIEDVQPEDVKGFTQCHFFAGIGGWSYALRLAGWPDSRSVWTGSCPCQPYSVASVGHGGAEGPRDQRDLWPSFFRLARQSRPSNIFGEQVASAIRWGWWDRAAMDLEAEGYATGAAVLRADAYRARHHRKRLFWLAEPCGARRKRHQPLAGVLVSAASALTEHGDDLARARRALDGDYSGLLSCDGLSVQLERDALRGYGNAIVPQVAQAFIESYMSIQRDNDCKT